LFYSTNISGDLKATLVCESLSVWPGGRVVFHDNKVNYITPPALTSALRKSVCVSVRVL